MNPGSLKHKITIQQEVFTDDVTTKERTPSWQDVCSIRAAVKPISGREYFQAHETHSEITIKFIIRYRVDITEGMRVIYNNNAYYIQGPPIDPDEAHRELQLMCAKKKPAGPGE